MFESSLFVCVTRKKNVVAAKKKVISKFPRIKTIAWVTSPTFFPVAMDLPYKESWLKIQLKTFLAIFQASLFCYKAIYLFLLKIIVVDPKKVKFCVYEYLNNTIVWIFFFSFSHSSMSTLYLVYSTIVCTFFLKKSFLSLPLFFNGVEMVLKNKL